MTSSRDTLSFIVGELPGRDAVIDRAFRQSVLFRDLCGDYRRCATALERWRRSEDAVSPARESEYAKLLNQLRSEIVQWLDAMDADSTPPQQRGLR
jgi:hypothetical protein